MAYIIEIPEDKVQSLSEHLGKMLKYGCKAMECIDEMQNETQMGERGGRYFPYTDGGFRDDDEDVDDWREEMRRRKRMGMRRGMSGTGRYGRY